jgi:hypothetical protein
MSDQLAAIVFDRSADWRRYPGCSESEIELLAASAPIRLPNDYLAFLRLSNGGEGPLCISPGWFIVWPAGEVLKWNQANERDKYYADLFLFGDCDGNLFGFDLTREFPWPLVALDYLDSKRECMDQLGSSFTEFARLMGRRWEPDVAT